MEGYDNVVSSSTPTKSPATPKPPAPDENDLYYQQVRKSTLPSPRNSTTKNYMSPTISAASKAISPRKNILGERNDKFSSTHVEKSHLSIDNGNDSLSQSLPLNPKVFQSHVSIDNGNVSLSQSSPLTHNTFQSHVDNEKNALSDSKPYDPVTNYLSPRPQFLRYKPNRRQELFLGLENGVSGRNGGLSLSRSDSFESQKAIDEELGDAATTPSSLDSPCEEGFLKQENEESEKNGEEVDGREEEIEECDEEVEESDEEYEEVEDGKGCKLQGVFKSLLLLLVLVLLSSHICTLNHEAPSEGVEMGYCSIRNHTLGASLLNKLGSGGNLWDQTEEKNMGLVEATKGDIVMRAVEGNAVGNEGEIEVMGQREEDLTEEDQRVIEEDVKYEGKVQDECLGGLEVTEEEMVGEIEEKNMGLMEAIKGDIVMGAVEGNVAENEGQIQVIGKREEDLMDEDPRVIDEEVKYEGKVEDEYLGGLEVTEEEKEGGIDELSDQLAKISSDHMAADEVDDFNLGSAVSNTFEEEGEVAVDQNMVENKMEAIEEYLTNLKEELMRHMKSNTFHAAAVGVSIFSVIAAALMSVFEELMRHMKSNTFQAAAVGVSIFSVIAAALMSVFRFKKRRNGVKRDSSVIANPAAKRLIIDQKAINEKLVSSPPMNRPSEAVLANKQQDSIEHHVYSSFRRLSLSEAAASEDGFNNPAAPTVELLTEFVVGKEESRNYSVSSKNMRGNAHSVSFQATPAASEFSVTDSPSLSYSTPQKTMKKKEQGGKDGEVTTPLRRSSRLRNRSVMSP